MTAPPFAEVSDLADWVGQEITSGTSESRAAALLMAASGLVVAEVGADITDAWTDIPDAVKAVVVQVAARTWFNPQGLVADAIDDYSRRWDQGGESGVYLTRGERDILASYRVKAVRGLWSLGTTRGDDYADQYLDVVNAATPSTAEEPIPFLPPGA